MHGRITVDMAELYKLSSSLGACGVALEVNDQRPDHGQIGRPDLAAALDGFYTNWNYKRRDLADRLKKLSQAVANTATAYGEIERDLKNAAVGDGSGGTAQPSNGVAAAAVGGGAFVAGHAGAPGSGGVGTPSTGPTELGGTEASLRAKFLSEWSPVRGGMDANNFAFNASGNCTSYVAWRLNDLAKERGSVWSFTNNHVGDSAVTVNKGRMGNAADWGNGATSVGMPPDHNPTVGSVAWWDSNAGKSSEGHVGVVRSIHSDGTIEVEESSWGTSVLSIKTYPKGSYPTGFLHLLPGT